MTDEIERALRRALDEVRCGRLARRRFMAQMSAWGLPVPMAATLLMNAGIAQSQPAFAYAPKRRGGGGTLRILSWQAATHLNPHLASGSKDLFASRLFYEPLAVFDRDGRLLPVLAAEVPSVDNGGVARDGRSVTWKLKRGVAWHDGEPFTADDVVATWEFARHPETAAFTLGTYQPITVRKLDSHAVRIEYDKPTPVWSDAFTGAGVLPRKHFAAYVGAKSREAPGNLKPVGTGPYRLLDFRPGDSLRAEINPAYHLPNRPHFDAVEIKGGGDAVSAARGVLQTAEFDFAWLLAVEDEILKRMEGAGRGRLDFATGGDIEYLMFNFADPWTEVDGERSSPSSRHPIFGDPTVRRAIAHLVDREAIQRYVYGRGGVATANVLNNPPEFNSRRTGLPFDIAKANALLDAAGWLRGAGGIRAKGGRRFELVFQTTTNAPRQKTQTILKQAAQQAGIAVELKSVVASVFFSSDPGNPDTAGHFQADLQMHTTTRGQPDPGRFMELFCSWLIASKANKWQGRNSLRWRNDEYDRLFRAAEGELDPVRRAAMLIRMNDIVCDDHAVIPLFCRPKVCALGNRLQAPISGWANELSQIHDWYRTA